MSRFRTLIVALVALIMAGAVLVPATAGATGRGDHRHAPPERTYRITVENLTEGQILTPPVVSLHRYRADLFDAGRPASFEVQQIAENGNLAPLQEALAANRKVGESGTVEGAPLLPGDVRSIELSVRPGHRLSTVSMVVCTNDGFTGLDAVRLPARTGGSVVFEAKAYDAGTEVNTEALADLVPPCSGFTTGTDMSNPALAEGGVIGAHPGITNDGTNPALLDPAVWGFESPVARYTIERIG